MPSGPNLYKIKDSISNGLEVLSNKSEDFIEISKLKYKLHFEENNMDNLYLDLGKELYSIFKTNSHINESLLDYCNALKKIENRIKNLDKEINKVNRSK
ncbi:hypothetical protein KPL37_03845 [Clostridium frigoris]|uniref:Uncharacterized protein n=1 Tax=Clostridium frigoris TaxID=205327 RepID=A0ABS6BPQ4_9CLOT|nr:hypothetical protein [Clostridium frigoris]MBU3158897.1 hypothetical protein [Clostridium frigoris]